MDATTAAIEVITKGLKPTITKNCPPFIASLIRSCLQSNPQSRPTFAGIYDMLDTYQKKLDDRNWYYPSINRSQADGILGGFYQDNVFMVSV